MSKNLKLVFAGTPEIACTIFAKILEAGYKPALVLTQPDRPKGRGQKLAMSPVKQLAFEHDIEVFQPLSFKKNPEAIAKVAEVMPDLMIVVAYGLILPQELLDIPKNGCVNIHVSLLPRYRGAAPIQRAILDGDTITGVTIMQMDSGLDTGDIIIQHEVEIAATDTSGSLHDKLAIIGAELIIKYLAEYKNLSKTPQSTIGVTYAHKIEKVEGQIDWNEDAVTIERKIRGYNPFPGCYTYLDGALVKIWQAALADSKKYGHQNPGTILHTGKQDNIIVACGNNTSLQIIQLQDAGKSRENVLQYLQRHSDLVGRQFT